MSSVAAEFTLETIEVMRYQEQSYQVSDYLTDLPVKALHEAPVDEECRTVMAKWCNDIADFCNYSRETAAIALNCLDRFMTTPDGRQVLLDRNQYQLAAMTALYTAVKIHEHEAMDPELVSTLSRGAHSAQAVEIMESRMLHAIQWRVNPPTATAFVRHMLDLVPSHVMDATSRDTITELTQFQVDLATCDYHFAQRSASHIAFASLMNAMDSVTSDTAFLAKFESTMANAIRVDPSATRDIRIALYESVHGNEPMEICLPPCNDKIMENYSSSGEFNTSPRSVNA
jgi:hypothetical protein